MEREETNQSEVMVKRAAQRLLNSDPLAEHEDKLD
jgi:hypothetical protein